MNGIYLQFYLIFLYFCRLFRAYAAATFEPFYKEFCDDGGPDVNVRVAQDDVLYELVGVGDNGEKYRFYTYNPRWSLAESFRQNGEFYPGMYRGRYLIPDCDVDGEIVDKTEDKAGNLVSGLPRHFAVKFAGIAATDSLFEPHIADDVAIFE